MGESISGVRSEAGTPLDARVDSGKRSQGPQAKLDEVRHELVEKVTGQRRITQELIDTSMKRFIERCTDSRVQLAAELQWHGGNCPFCKTPFARYEWKNAVAEFVYYEPYCFCFKRCETVKTKSGVRPGCGTWMIAERLLGIDHCTNCDRDHYQEKPVTVKLEDIVKKKNKA